MTVHVKIKTIYNTHKHLWHGIKNLSEAHSLVVHQLHVLTREEQKTFTVVMEVSHG